MERRPAMNRGRQRQQQGPDTFDRARDEYGRHHAELEQDVRHEHREADQPTELHKRMDAALKRSGKENTKKK